MTRERIPPPTFEAPSKSRIDPAQAPPEPAPSWRDRAGGIGRSSPPPRTAPPRFDFAALHLHDERPHRAVQFRATRDGATGHPVAGPSVYATAVAGVRTGGEPLPYRERIQRAFGPAQDLTRISAHIGGRAGEASARLGADGYAIGEHVAFRAAPDLRLAAHEAAHVVQQRGGVQLKDNVGRPGDRYEQQADAIADAVLAGRSVAALLDPPAPGRARAGVQMQLWGHTQHPQQPVYPKPPTPACDPRALAAIDNEVVELMGTPSYDPSYWLAEGLRCVQPASVFVHARFGTLANGTLRVRAVPVPVAQMTAPGARTRMTYETATNDEFLDLHHPSFPGDGVHPPRLYIAIINGMVSGEVSLATPDRTSPTAQWELARALGWRGLSDIRATHFNRLNNGVLRFEMNPFTFRLSDATDLGGKRYDDADLLDGTGTFTVRDASESFAARANVKGDGVAAGALPLRKTAMGISGAAAFALNLAPKDLFGGKFSGGIRGTFAGGQLTLEGTARYQSRRVNGELTLVLAPRAAAWARVAQVLPRGKLIVPPVTPNQASYALVGWGTVDFALNDWLTGSVSAMLDPDGYITSHGILRPTREFQFLTEPEDFTDPATHPDARAGERRHKARKGEVQLGSTLEAMTPSIPVAGAVNVSGEVKASLFAAGRVGPGRVYDIEIQGSFSTRPGSVLEASATGRINLSAWGRLRVVVSGRLNFEVIADVVKLGSVGVDGAGTLDVRAYAELQPKFERIADKEHPDQANYRVSGVLNAGGSAELGLNGEIVAEFVGKTLFTIDLDRYQWHLGSLALRAEISHVIGSHDPISLNIKPDAFDTSRFSSVLDALIHDRGDRTSAHHPDQLPQDKATLPPPRPDTPTNLSRTFKMNGAPHRLWVEHAPNAVIKMASPGEGGRLDDKLAAEETVVEHAADQQTGGVAQALNEEAAEVRDLRRQSLAAEHSLDNLQSKAREVRDVAGFQELADALSSYGTQFEKTDLAEQERADLSRSRREERERVKAQKAARRATKGSENVARFPSLNEARTAAHKAAGLGNDAVDFVQEIGPHAGRVTGRMSPDGLRGWRIDFDSSKGFHVNWWDRTGGPKRAEWFYGANSIEGGTLDDFLQLLQHFPEK